MINSLHSKLATWYGKIHGVKRKPVSGSAPPRPIRVFFSHHVFFRIRSLTYYVTNNPVTSDVSHDGGRRTQRIDSWTHPSRRCSALFTRAKSSSPLLAHDQSSSPPLARAKSSSSLLARAKSSSALLAYGQSSSALLAYDQWNSAVLARDQSSSALLNYNQSSSAVLAYDQSNSAVLARTSFYSRVPTMPYHSCISLGDKRTSPHSSFAY